jgi:hypothetical protein
VRISLGAATVDSVAAFRIERARRPALLPPIPHEWGARVPIVEDGQVRDDAFVVHHHPHSTA